MLALTLKRLVRHPFHFLLLQIPETSLEVVERLLSLTPWQRHPLVDLLFLLPYFWIASALSCAATYVSVADLDAGNKPTLRHAFLEVARSAGRLIPACMLAGTIIVVGIPLLLPGLYFMTVYLFVPQIAVSQRDASISVVLSRSKRLVKQAFLPTFLVTLTLLAVGFAAYAAGGKLGEMLTQQVKPPNLQVVIATFQIKATTYKEAVLILAKVFISLVAGATINVGLAHYFLKRRASASP